MKFNGEKDSVYNFGIFGGPTLIDFDADDELVFVDDWNHLNPIAVNALVTSKRHLCKKYKCNF